MTQPITSPEGYRGWWTRYTVIVIVVVTGLIWFLGPIVIERGLSRWSAMK